MPRAVADTSFLFSLYGADAHTAAARSWIGRKREPVAITLLGRYELGNALRFAAFRNAISGADCASALAAFESDLKVGYLQLAPCDFPAIIGEAQRLSELHTLAGGHRSFDILHVATARTLKADAFLSFDAKQRKLARAVGLPVAP